MANIDQLSIQISSDSRSAVSGIDALSNSLSKLKSATSGGLGLNSIAKNLATIKTSLSGMGTITGQISGLERAIQTLSKLGNVKVSASIGNQIKNIGAALSGLNIGDGATKITELVTALKPLETLGKSSLGSTVNALNKLPEAIQKIDMKKLHGQVDALTRTFKPLADEMQKIANGFNAFPSRIQNMIKGNEQLSTSNTKTTKSYVNLYAKMRMAYTTLRTGARVISSAISKINDYIENVNLFNVSMGEYAKEAGEYAETVGEVMGIDPGEWMRNQGMFMTLATGFGVVSDRAYTMSKNLTQLGYDLSSFFNISYEDAMAKLQSGIAGELEPLRRIGYDLSQTRLQQEAYTLGIDKKLAKMTQAEKAELRYHAILTQVTTAQGDMARTLDAPANQLRVLKAQLSMAGRALGSIFIPLLKAVLPWVIAFTKAIRELAEGIASMLGFEMPEVDYSGVNSLASGAEDATDALGEAADNAKKLQQYTLGLDELNVIDPNKGSSDSSSSSGIGGKGFDFELPEYDFMNGAISDEVDKIFDKLRPGIDWLKENMGTILQIALAIKAATLAWSIVGFGQGMFDMFKSKDGKKLASNFKMKAGITLMVTGVTLSLFSGYSIGYDGLTKENFIKTLIGSALTIGGSLLAFGTGPLGWAVGIGTSLLVTIGSIAFGYASAMDDRRRKMVEGIIFNGEGTDIATYKAKLEVTIAETASEHDVIGEWKKELDEIDTTLDTTAISIQTLHGTLAAEGVATKLEIDKIKEHFGTLYDGIRERMTLSEQVITTALVGALKRATPEIAGQIDLLIGEYQRYVRETQGRAEELKLLIDNGYDELIGKGKDDPAYQQIMSNINEWYTELGYLGGSMSDAAWKWEDTVNKVNNNEIDLGDNVDDAKTKIGELVTTAQNALIDLNTARDTIFKEIDSQIKYAATFGTDDEVQMLMDVRSQIEADYAKQEEGIKNSISDVFGKIQTTLVNKVGEVSKEAAKAWEKEDSWFGPSKPEYVKAAVEDLQDIVGDISSELKTGIETLGMDGEVWANEAMKKIIDKMFDSEVIYGGKATSGNITKFGKSVETAIAETFDELTEKGKIKSTAAGEAIGGGLGQGISDATASVKEASAGLATASDTAFREAAEINSPSKLFATNGGYLVDGLIEGIKAKTTELKDTMSSVIKSAFDTTWASTHGYSFGEALAKGIVKAIKATSFPTIKGITDTDSATPKISFKAYAGGGFPTTGEVFVAREAGAEMVGSIGRRTAVANNDQIVAGIASGVASANSESNALLREQNGLLRAMLEKETGVYLDGKSLTKSVEKHQRERGRVLVTGGAY